MARTTAPSLWLPGFDPDVPDTPEPSVETDLFAELPAPQAQTPRYVPGIKYILMLGALAALPAVTTDMYLPSLPAVAEDLQASQAAPVAQVSRTRASRA